MERRCMYFARTRAGKRARKRYAEHSAAVSDDPVRNFLIAFFRFCARRNRTKYLYDANSNRTHIQYPSGGIAYYAFDQLDRMSSVQSPAGHTTSYEFDASGNRTKSVWGNGAWTYYAYDKAERVLSIRHFDDGGLAIAYFDYGRDSRGNITKIARLNGDTIYYEYDLADRLTRETWKTAAGGTDHDFEWQYDAAGNRTAQVIDGGTARYYSYNAANALTGWEAGLGSYEVCSYDDDGNLTTLVTPGNTVTYFEHGAHGLVTKITPVGGTEVTFGYDALLRRVKMVEGAVTTSFKHDGLDLIEVSDNSGNLTKLTHGYKTIDGIGSVVEVEKNGTRYYLHQDHRGTTYKITNSSGDVVWTGLCDAWGNVISESGSNPSIFWYQGQAWWKLTVNDRLYYVSPTRMYDAEDRRFVERDPEGGFAGSFLYGQENPIVDVDPAGATYQITFSPKSIPPQVPADIQVQISRDLEQLKKDHAIEDLYCWYDPDKKAAPGKRYGWYIADKPISEDPYRYTHGARPQGEFTVTLVTGTSFLHVAKRKLMDTPLGRSVASIEDLGDLVASDMHTACTAIERAIGVLRKYADKVDDLGITGVYKQTIKTRGANKLISLLDDAFKTDCARNIDLFLHCGYFNDNPKETGTRATYEWRYHWDKIHFWIPYFDIVKTGERVMVCIDELSHSAGTPQSGDVSSYSDYFVSQIVDELVQLAPP